MIVINNLYYLQFIANFFNISLENQNFWNVFSSFSNY